jgi:hypothetical protein
MQKHPPDRVNRTATQTTFKKKKKEKKTFVTKARDLETVPQI